MSRFIKRMSKSKGLPPGTLVHIGDKRIEKAEIGVLDYDERNILEKRFEKVEECFPFKDKPSVTWININGIEHTEVIEKIDYHFGIHPLVLEDIVNTWHRPKFEDYEDYLFIVLKALSYDNKKGQVFSEQISLITGPNYCISFQEVEGHIFDSIRERIRNNKGRIRKMKSDYLAYCLIDAVVDQYFEILEHLSEEIEELENRLISGIGKDISAQIHRYKNEMVFLKKQILPLREILNALQRNDSKLIKKDTRIYFNDIYDHAIQILDTIESYRDMLIGMHDIYLSSISNKMNEVMKVLTIFASIFIPLTFLTGVYGMNFQYMPELKWKYGYLGVIIIMLIVTGAMIGYFKKKKWF